MKNCKCECRQRKREQTIEKGLENLIHQCLECRGRIRQAEWHDQELEEAFMSVERRFVDIDKVHVHLVVAGT
jgi:hypothetical protein